MGDNSNSFVKDENIAKMLPKSYMIFMKQRIHEIQQPTVLIDHIVERFQLLWIKWPQSFMIT